MPVSRSAMPKRVFMTADAVGGVWSYALELARGLCARGAAVELAVLGPEPDTCQIAAAARVRGLSLTATRLALDWTARSELELERAVGELKLLARQFDADLVHLHAPALAGTKRWTVPLVVSMHSCLATWWCANRSGPMPDDFIWRTRQTSFGIAVADCTITPSRTFASDVEKLYGQGVVVSAVLNGRRPAELAPGRKRPQVFTAGRLWDEGKNVAVIDRAAVQIRWPIYAAGPLAGPNGASASLANLHLLGTLSAAEMADWYARSPIFVSASRYEPFGLTVLEAAQAGAALVLADIATFRELWHDAACFVPVDDSNALAAVLEDLAARPRKRALWGARARERAQDYTVERMIAATVEVYGSVLAAPCAQAI